MSPLKIEDGALCLSGTTGSKLKTDIVGSYLRFWQSVTSGGGRRAFNISTLMIDMNAGTGLLRIEDADETVFGSAGHILNLGYKGDVWKNRNLHIALIESDQDCRKNLLENIKNHWPMVKLKPMKGYYISEDQRTIVFSSQPDFLRFTGWDSMDRTSLFYFDPLRATEWSIIDRIAEMRITKPYRMRTEFLVFFFTSDWILGRKDFTPLPRTKDKSKWTRKEKESVASADEAFGGRKWSEILSKNENIQEMEEELVELYKNGLRKWFRFVQPLPFNPKTNQRYDLFCCSNYDVGMRVIRSFYETRTAPIGVRKKASEVYPLFRKLHPNLVRGLKGRMKPTEWKILWHVIKNHIDGICDEKCQRIRRKSGNDGRDIREVLEKLEKFGYLRKIEPSQWPWESEKFSIYQVDWNFIETHLKVREPRKPQPIGPDGKINSIDDDIDNYNEQMTLDDY